MLSIATFGSGVFRGDNVTFEPGMARGSCVRMGEGIAGGDALKGWNRVVRRLLKCLVYDEESSLL